MDVSDAYGFGLAGMGPVLVCTGMMCWRRCSVAVVLRRCGTTVHPFEGGVDVALEVVRRVCAEFAERCCRFRFMCRLAHLRSCLRTSRSAFSSEVVREFQIALTRRLRVAFELHRWSLRRFAAETRSILRWRAFA